MYFHFFPEIASAVLKILSQYGLVKCRSPLLKKKKKEDRIFGLVAEKRTAQKMKFSIKDFFRKCDQILNGKLHFLCNVKTNKNSRNQGKTKFNPFYFNFKSKN